MIVKNKLALITGATSGIGEATAKIFAKNGIDLILCGRRQNRLDQLKKECAYLGNLNDLHTILRTTEIDEVFIALPTSENEKIQNCIAICDGLNIKVRILPNLSEFTSSSIYINNIGLLPVVNVGDLPLDKKENRKKGEIKEKT